MALDPITEEIRQRADIVDVIGQYVALRPAGGERWKACCPFHDEKTPSFNVSRDKGFYKCFGCLDEEELIWVRDGLKRIGDVLPGDEVLDQHGDWRPIVAFERKHAPVLAVKTAGFRRDPLHLTSDHTCVFVRAADARAALPYLYLCSQRGTRFKSAYRRYKSKEPVLTEAAAEQLSVGDFVLFPVVAEAGRLAEPLSAPQAIAPYKIGKRVQRIEKLPVDSESAFVYGLYLAEGSTNVRSLRWTFHVDEKDLALEVARVLRTHFDLTSTHYQILTKNIHEVICCKSDLARQFEHWFGKGCASKRIPSEALSWPREIQRALLVGYRCGDGNRRGDTKTVSRQLAYGLYALAIQCGLHPALSYYPAYVSAKGQSHREHWALSNRTRDGLAGFYQEINGTLFYWSQVTSIVAQTEVRPVVDITVAESHSFTTKMGVVHNCGKSGDVFRFVGEMENLPFNEVKKQLAERYGVALPAARELTPERKAEFDEKDRLVKITAAAAAFYRQQFTGNPGMPARDYARSRGLSPATIEKFGIGYAPDAWESVYAHLVQRMGFTPDDVTAAGLLIEKTDDERTRHYDRYRHRLMFPIWDVRGQVIAFGGRALEDGKTGNPDAKYINSPEGPLFSKSNILYAYHIARSEVGKRESVIITEGYMDAIALHEGGFGNTVATLGTALTVQHVDLLRRMSPKVVYLCFDGDSAGMRAALRTAPLFAAKQLDVRVVSLPSADDPDTYIRKHGQVGFETVLRNARLLSQYRLETAVAEHDLGTIPGRKAAIRAGAEVIAEVGNDTEKDAYITWLAEQWARAEGITAPARLQMVEAAVRREVSGVTKRWQSRDQNRSHAGPERPAFPAQVSPLNGAKRRFEPEPPGIDFQPPEEEYEGINETIGDAISGSANNGAPSGVVKAERALLSVLLIGPSWRERILQDIKPVEWTQEVHREIAVALAKIEGDTPVNPTELIATLTEEAAGTVAELMLSDESQVPPNDDVVIDWIARVRIYWARQREQIILELIRGKLERNEKVTEEERKLLNDAFLATKRKRPPEAA